MSSPQILPPENQESGLVSTVKKLLLPDNQADHQPRQQTQNQNPASSSGNSSNEFAATAAELGEKYSGNAEGASADSGSGGAIPPNSAAAEPPRQIVTPEIVEGVLVMLTEGIAKQHGNHWRMTDVDKTVLVPVNTAMLNEQIPRLFPNLENPAFWAWGLVMAGWIGTKSENVGNAVQAGIEKIISLISGNGGNVAG